MTERTIKSPLPGTFYQGPSSDAHPFVSEGQRVGVGEAVGLGESIKGVHEVRPEASRVLERPLLEGQVAVEANQYIAALRNGGGSCARC
jgi:acetyl-CoA carboxylase biotin carboxyl carrier protein